MYFYHFDGIFFFIIVQKGCDVNQGDVSGVTPLMLTSALGHRSSFNVIMEFARNGRVQLNINEKDDSDFTALDYAAVSGNAAIIDSLKGRSKR